MKKTILFLLTIMLTPSVFASGVGYIDYNVMYENIPISVKMQEEIDAKANAVREYNKKTSELSRAQTTPEAKAKVISDRKVGLQKIERDYIDLRYKQEAIVRAKVKAAGEIVLMQKKLDIIVDKKSTVAGGIDCTQEVLKAIK